VNEKRLGVSEKTHIWAVDEVTGDYGELHNEVRHALHCSQSIFWVIRSRKMKWAGHVARMGQKSSAYRCSCVETLREKD
jgi:hypothetical protein